MPIIGYDRMSVGPRGSGRCLGPTLRGPPSTPFTENWLWATRPPAPSRPPLLPERGSRTSPTSMPTSAVLTSPSPYIERLVGVSPNFIGTRSRWGTNFPVSGNARSPLNSKPSTVWLVTPPCRAHRCRYSVRPRTPSYPRPHPIQFSMWATG